jgi:hypothetical protein
VNRKDLKMTFPNKSHYPLLRLTAAGALAALVVPTAAGAWRSEPGQSGLTPSQATSERSQVGSQLDTQYVVVNGDRVPVSSLSQYLQASAPGSWSRGQLVQIGGQLISPSQLSAWQARAHQAPLPASQLVQVGGRLVTPSQVSSVESRLGSSTPVPASSSGDGFDWSTAGIGAVGFVLLVGASGYFVLRTRRRVTTTA